jgi:urea transport system permease protein
MHVLSTYLVALFGTHLLRHAGASIDLRLGLCGHPFARACAPSLRSRIRDGRVLMRKIGTRGVYANPCLVEDFMVFLNWQELPFYWYGFNHFASRRAHDLLAPGVLAFVFSGSRSKPRDWSIHRSSRRR